MSNIRARVAAAAAACALLSTGLVTTAGPAAAKSGCMSNREWDRVYLGDSKRRVHHEFDTRGWRLDKDRRGHNGRLLVVSRAYESCLYPEDEIEHTYDDYSYGSRSRGGQLKLSDGIWTHHCIDSDDYKHEFYCNDRGWEGWYDYPPDPEGSRTELTRSIRKSSQAR